MTTDEITFLMLVRSVELVNDNIDRCLGNGS